VVTEDCKKRPVSNPAVYFSHFSSWADVKTVTLAQLNAVPNHPLNFLPWGPLKTFGNGSLVKNVDDPKVYLVQNGKAYPVADENAFKALGYSFSMVEDVTADALARFQKQTVAVHGPIDAPATLLF
jgi:hypothetical protein